MELNIITFNSASLVSHAQRATVQALIDTLKADIFCVSETHLSHRHNVNFTVYSTIRHNSAALLVKKDYYFVELKMASTSQLQKRVKVTIRSFAHTDSDKFKSDLAPMLNLKKLATDRNLSDKEIDEAVILATDAIHPATRRNTRLIKVDEIVYKKLPHDIVLHMKVRQIWRRNLKRNFYKNGNKINAE